MSLVLQKGHVHILAAIKFNTFVDLLKITVTKILGEHRKSVLCCHFRLHIGKFPSRITVMGFVNASFQLQYPMFQPSCGSFLAWLGSGNNRLSPDLLAAEGCTYSGKEKATMLTLVCASCKTHCELMYYSWFINGSNICTIKIFADGNKTNSIQHAKFVNINCCSLTLPTLQ